MHPARNRTKLKKSWKIKNCVKKKGDQRSLPSCRQRLVRDRGLQRVKRLKNYQGFKNIAIVRPRTEQPQPPPATPSM